MATLDDIDRRTKVGTKAWDKNHDEKTKRLSAWRRLHALLPHDEVKKRAQPNQSSAVLAEIVKKVEQEQREQREQKEI